MENVKTAVDSSPRSSHQILLVSDQDAFFTEDFELSVKEVSPDAEIFMAPDIASASAIVASLPKLTAAFIKAEPEELLESGLAIQVSTQGARVVVMDRAGKGEVTLADPDWLYLPVPYSSATVQGVLAALSQRAMSDTPPES